MLASLPRYRPRRLHVAVVALLGLAIALIAAPAESSPSPPSAAESASGSAGQAADDAPSAQQQLPSSFEWSSTDPLISPAENINSVAAKDPSVVQDENGTWHVLFTRVDTNGDWGLAQTSFTDWAEAGSAPQTDLEAESAIGGGYRAAPHVFQFEPTGEWYLVYQDGLPAFSTTTDINDPTSWSAPQHFMDSVPDVVEQNIGNSS